MVTLLILYLFLKHISLLSPLPAEFHGHLPIQSHPTISPCCDPRQIARYALIQLLRFVRGSTRDSSHYALMTCTGPRKSTGSHRETKICTQRKQTPSPRASAFPLPLPHAANIISPTHVARLLPHPILQKMLMPICPGVRRVCTLYASAMEPIPRPCYCTSMNHSSPGHVP